MERASSMTMIEKVLARASGHMHVQAGEMVQAAADRFILTSLADVARELSEAGVTRLRDPSKVWVIHDQVALPFNITSANEYVASREACRRLGVEGLFDFGRAGICHVVAAEEALAAPGELVLSDDIDALTLGALNVGATGIPDISYALTTGEAWFEVPATVKWVLEGTLSSGVTAKDVGLYLVGRYGPLAGAGRSGEYTGSLLGKLSLESRLCLANMGHLLGHPFVLFEADQRVLNYYAARGQKISSTVTSDPGATYAAAFEVDVSEIEPQVAAPHHPWNAKPVSEVVGKRIDQAYIGSCANSRFEDLVQVAHIVQGRKIHPDVRMIVTPGSQKIYNQAVKAGLVKTLMKADIVVTSPGVAAESGYHAGVLGAGEVCISSAARNFQGRMGSPASEVYLGSAATVAASALRGQIADPREYL